MPVVRVAKRRPVTAVGSQAGSGRSRGHEIESGAGDDEEEPARRGVVAPLCGFGQLLETRIEPRLRCRHGEQPGDARMLGPQDFFVGFAEVLPELFTGTDARDLNLDVHAHPTTCSYVPIPPMYNPPGVMGTLLDAFARVDGAGMMQPC